MQENKISNVYIKNKFKINYLSAIIMIALCSIIILTIQNLIIISKITIFICMTIINIYLLIIQYSKTNCQSYKIIEYIGDRNDLEKFGYKIIADDGIMKIGIKEIQ